MTDRIRHITITLERDTREDDAEVILGAIKMIRGVAIVTPHLVAGTDNLARLAVGSDIRQKLLEAVVAAFDVKGKP
jgi:hypothetical protein